MSIYCTENCIINQLMYLTMNANLEIVTDFKKSMNESFPLAIIYSTYFSLFG